MEVGNRILNYYKDLDLKFNQLLVEVLNSFEEEVIHKFRVNIKKQVALFHLLDFVVKDFQIDAVKTLFHGIFKKAGAIRKVHIEKNILTNNGLKLDLAPDILKRLEEQLAIKTERFQQYNYAADLEAINENSNSLRQQIHSALKTNLNQGLNKYFKQLLNDLVNLSNRCKTDEKDFHELRKMLKELFYNLNFLNQPFNQKQPSASIFKYLSEIQTNLGEWHDVHLTLNHFSMLKNPAFDDLLGALKDKNDWYVEKIRTQLHDFEGIVARIESELCSFVK